MKRRKRETRERKCNRTNEYTEEITKLYRKRKKERKKKHRQKATLFLIYTSRQTDVCRNVSALIMNGVKYLIEWVFDVHTLLNPSKSSTKE